MGHYACDVVLMALRNIPAAMIKGKLDRRSVIGRELQDVTVGLLEALVESGAVPSDLSYGGTCDCH